VNHRWEVSLSKEGRAASLSEVFDGIIGGVIRYYGVEFFDLGM